LKPVIGNFTGNRLTDNHFTTLFSVPKKGYCHQSATEQKHKDKVSCSAAERAFLKHSTVSIREDHVKQKVKADRSKKHEIRQQSPYLKQMYAK